MSLAFPFALAGLLFPCMQTPAGGASATSAPAQFDLFDGYECVSWSEAAARAGDRVVVYGQVKVAGSNSGGRLLFFDGPANKETICIFVRKNAAAFMNPSPDKLVGRWVAVLGVVDEYEGRPELVVNSPASLRLIEGPLTPTSRPAAPPTSRPAGVVRIGSYNVLNLFDDVDDPYRADEGTPFKSRREMSRVAEMIRRLDADVLVLVEVENRGILERFNRVYLAGMGYEEVVLVEGNDARGIDCAVLSRLPVGPVTSYRHVSFPMAGGRTVRFRRDLLQARIEPPGMAAFEVFAVHLKSKRGEGGGSPPIREAEAAKLRAVSNGLLSADPKARFVICGDFNDTWESPALRTIRGTGDRALTCFLEQLPANDRVTYNRNPHRSAIDFILCSPGMATRYVANSYRVLEDAASREGSDHNPVSADFRMNERPVE